jgi:large subunit ribosomal protein L21e
MRKASEVIDMVKRSRGPRSATRKKLSKKPRERGLSPITKSLQKFEIGEKACIVIDPSSHKGQPHPRFHGLTGEVIGLQGNTYKIDVKVGNKVKTLLVRSEHLKKIKSQPT